VVRYVCGMAEFDTQRLIDVLQGSLRQQLAHVEEWRALPVERLHQPPAPGRWSVMEVLEHMNLSSGHYHQRLHQLYTDTPHRLQYRATFRPGFWGDRFTQGMMPRPDKSIGWKMRTLPMFEPRPRHVEGWQALDRIAAMSRDMIDLLEKARQLGLEGARIGSTLGPLLRFKPGDAFRFPVAHQERHMLQIERTLAALDHA
jgi:hypothetical protein